MLGVVLRSISIAVFLPVLACCGGGGASLVEFVPAGDLTIPCSSVPDQHNLHWGGGVLVRILGGRTASPVLCRFDRTGNQLPDVPLSIPGIDIMGIGNVAVAPDGRIAVHGTAYDRNAARYTSFLSVLSKEGQQQFAIQPRPYWIGELVFAPDGVLWTAGADTDGVRDVNTNHAIIRRWNEKGELIGGMARRFEVRAPKPLGHPSTQSWFTVSKDRVGWYSAISRVYIEYSLDERQLGRYKAVEVPDDAGYRGIAMTDDGTVFISTDYVTSMTPKPVQSEDVWVLDREHNSWIALAKKGPLARSTWIIGAEGPHLVVYAGRDKLRLLLPATLTSNP